MSAQNDKIIFLATLSIFFITLAIQAHISNTLTIRGSDMIALETEKSQLEKEISELKLEHSNYATMPYLEKKAKELGFIEIPGYVSNIEPASATVVETSLLKD